MTWQLIALWLSAHPAVVNFGTTWTPTAASVRMMRVDRELFHVDQSGQLHLVEHDPAVIACAWVHSISRLECKRK